MQSRVDALMARYARGDDAAFAELHALTVARLLGLFRRLGVARADAQDLTQETFLRLHRVRNAYSPPRPALPWLSAIARNVFVDRHRAEGARTRYQLRYTELPSSGLDVSHPESLAIAEQTVDQLTDAVAALPERTRRAFVLARVEGRSLEATARAIGATKAATKLVLFRAARTLRASLEA